MVVRFRLNMSIVNAPAELKFLTLSFIISGTASYQDRWMDWLRIMSDDDECIELWCCATIELVSKFNNFFSPMVQLRCVRVVGVQAVALRKKRENLNTVLLLNTSSSSSSSSSLAASNKTTTNYH